MSEADKMFEELGYHKYLENEDTILYKREGNNKNGYNVMKSNITFDLRLKTFEGEFSLFVPHRKDWQETKFENEWLKYSAAQGHWSTTTRRFEMEELKAINKKCEELGWI